MEKGYRSIGQNIRRLGAIERLRGAPIFSADMDLENPLVLKVLRSGRAHAKILAIDTGKAQRIEGVVKVFTAADIPGKNLMGIINRDQPLLASDKVRSISDPVALVAAETQKAAEEALKAINVA